MEKAFVLSSAIPELATNGKVSVYPTLDQRVNFIVIPNSNNFLWKNRKGTECFRCPRCNSFVFPEEEFKKEKKSGQKYHKNCNFLKEKQCLKEKEGAQHEDSNRNQQS